MAFHWNQTGKRQGRIMSYKVLDSIKSQDTDSLKEQLAIDVLTGFTSKEKYLSSKYFYDEIGSDLFVNITKSEDYYPTKCEAEIIENHKSAIVERFRDEKLNLIELGAGDGHKTQLLINEIIKNKIPLEYNPIDISIDAIEGVTNKLKEQDHLFKTFGIVGEYLPALKWAKKNKEGQNLILFLGSNIGNFSLVDSIVFLRTIWNNLSNNDQILIGFDLKKDISTLLSAYNDSEGVTAKFNLNILRRINNDLGGNFDLNNFEHFGTYNPKIGAMESYLISKKEQTVRINHLEKEFTFKEYESIHLEYSFKYLKEDIEYLAKETGFEIIENFTDKKGYFVDSLWKVVKK
jgi:L-histidine N-alpha-methyltransferase